MNKYLRDKLPTLFKEASCEKVNLGINTDIGYQIPRSSRTKDLNPHVENWAPNMLFYSDRDEYQKKAVCGGMCYSGTCIHIYFTISPFRKKIKSRDLPNFNKITWLLNLRNYILSRQLSSCRFSLDILYLVTSHNKAFRSRSSQNRTGRWLQKTARS